MARDGSGWLEMAREMARDGSRWLGMARDGLGCSGWLGMLGMAREVGMARGDVSAKPSTGVSEG
eukprot:5174684-Prymnesium_polylepis.1